MAANDSNDTIRATKEMLESAAARGDLRHKAQGSELNSESLAAIRAIDSAMDALKDAEDNIVSHQRGLADLVAHMNHLLGKLTYGVRLALVQSGSGSVPSAAAAQPDSELGAETRAAILTIKTALQRLLATKTGDIARCDQYRDTLLMALSSGVNLALQSGSTVRHEVAASQQYPAASTVRTIAFKARDMEDLTILINGWLEMNPKAGVIDIKYEAVPGTTHFRNSHYAALVIYRPAKDTNPGADLPPLNSQILERA